MVEIQRFHRSPGETRRPPTVAVRRVRISAAESNVSITPVDPLVYRLSFITPLPPLKPMVVTEREEKNHDRTSKRRLVIDDTDGALRRST